MLFQKMNDEIVYLTVALCKEYTQTYEYLSLTGGICNCRERPWPVGRCVSQT